MNNYFVRRNKGFFRYFILSAACLFIVGCSLSTTGPDSVVAEKRVVLVQDVSADAVMPRNFRTTDTICAFLENSKSTIDTKGLIGLCAVGSAEFSEAGLSWLKRRFGDSLIIVDLRQESHGFVNGAAVTWYARNNWVNLGKAHEEALRDENIRLNTLARDKVIRVYDGKAVKHGVEDSGKFVEIERVRSEQELAGQYNIRYFRLTVPDHMRPSDEEVDRFVAFVRNLGDGDWLHFHCRAGMGRTTTFLVMYDMLRNADKVSLDDIIARQAAVPPNYYLFKSREGSPQRGMYEDRTKFVKLFYEYAKAFCAGEKANWTEWLRRSGRKIFDRVDK